MTAGAPRHLADDGDFVMVRMSLVDDIGFDAAILFGWLRFRCEIFRDGYVATLAELGAETRLSEHKIKKASKLLRDRGWVKSRRVSPYDPTPVWEIVWAGQEPHSRDGDFHRHEEDESTVTSRSESPSPPIKKVRNPPTPDAVVSPTAADVPPTPASGGACTKHIGAPGLNCRACGTTNRQRARAAEVEAAALRRAQDAEELRKARENRPDASVAADGVALVRAAYVEARRTG